jgi:putative nucleotidyltransferase with HDIG domain
MDTAFSRRSPRQLNSAHDADATRADHRATAQDLQRGGGSQYPQPAQARGPDDQPAQLPAAELEFMHAMQAYKRSSGRQFPTWSEVLEVLRSLGYQKRPRDLSRDTGRPLPGSQTRPADIDPSRIDDATVDATIEGWVQALSRRDKETEEHTRRVTDMTVKLARAMHLDPADLIQIRRGALLHDIGKMGIPDAILHKPGPLSEEERDVMRHHPTYAYEWLAPILALRPALDIPYCHHERWDGTGYPRGLKGEQIPLAARIFAVVDSWDALRSDRPYRGAWPEEVVRHRIRALAGTHLDSEVVEAFLGMMPGDDMIGLAPKASGALGPGRPG